MTQLTNTTTSTSTAARFPAHWGSPPAIQTKDYHPLPRGYGMGSGTMKAWIEDQIAKDNANVNPVRGAQNAKLPPSRVQALPPAWILNGLEPPAGERDMGGWTAAYFTEEQQAHLQVDEEGNPSQSTNKVESADRDANHE